jgi:ubiquinol-cytochrome c reductase cytochrome b subunit
MRLLKTHSLAGLFNSYIVDSPQPSNISYAWNAGSLLGLCLITQLATGIFLAMHYVATADFAFISVESIMRDVTGG